MLPTVDANMTLKEIMELHPKLEDKLRTYGFDVCCAKMDSLAAACERKELSVEKVLRDLNSIVEEINLVESVIAEEESKQGV